MVSSSIYGRFSSGLRDFIRTCSVLHHGGRAGFISDVIRANKSPPTRLRNVIKQIGRSESEERRAFFGRWKLCVDLSGHVRKSVILVQSNCQKIEKLYIFPCCMARGYCFYLDFKGKYTK